MKLSEALKISNLVAQRDARNFSIALVSGCSPLSLPTFIAAHLGKMKSDMRFAVLEATYGDIVNSVQSGYDLDGDALAIIIDYPALDARLGLRRSSNWNDEAIADIISNVDTRLGLIKSTIAKGRNRRTVIHPPVLALPPLAGSASWQANPLQAALDVSFSKFFASILDISGVFVVNPKRDAIQSDRNVDGELTADFPYSQQTSSAICEGFAQCLVPPTPLKGIITDLDDTLWRGLVGEVGIDHVHWSLDEKSQIHAVYQQLLSAMASRGILIAVASKNDQEIVNSALNRDDLLIKSENVFPIIANWDAKSLSVEKILKIWNISEDAVVFVDDNPYELDEVRRRYPSINVLQFYPKDARETYAQLTRLRDMCYRETRSEEDTLRLASIRASASIAEEIGGALPMEDFLAGLDATITFDMISAREDKRAFELVNKTNQFNLNGKRYLESEWESAIEDADSFCMSISYADKFGPLGKIGVLIGRKKEEAFCVDQWVLSCRAFSRRVEHATLQVLLETFPGISFKFNYVQTEKNRPLSEMIGEIMHGDGTPTAHDEIVRFLPKVHAKIVHPVLTSIP